MECHVFPVRTTSNYPDEDDVLDGRKPTSTALLQERPPSV